ncbi:hypothetical protein HT031_004232 [Scenedesmus sp. PABB004]|nr:hypothetical protein HT031_004232 [Scenedesmus sp. PABB004]
MQLPQAAAAHGAAAARRGARSQPPPAAPPAAPRRQQQQQPPRERRRARLAPLRAAGSEGAEQHGAVPPLLSLPLFPLPSVLHPAQAGQLMVFEPRYLSLFTDLQQAAAAAAARGGRAELQFGHVVSAEAAPPALLAEGAVGGLPGTGVVATVRSIEALEGGRLAVHYRGWRRFRLLAIDRDAKPYPVAAAAWLDDAPPPPGPGAAAAQAAVDALELEVHGLLQQVAAYAAQLGLHAHGPGAAPDGGVLPEAVRLYAPPPPPPPRRAGVADYLVRAGGPTGAAVATWQRMGSVYDDGGGGGRRRSSSAARPPDTDPYQKARDAVLGKARRQELFSFAAASLLELGVAERLALLTSRDTGARLQFVAAAVRPFLSELVARAAVKQAVQPAAPPP